MNIFNKEYWLAACRELKDIRKLAFAALICAVTVIMDGFLKIPVLPGGLEIKVTFFVIALGCAVYGPVAGGLIAVVVDTLSVILFPTGYPYFPGYLLTELLVTLFYCVFLYRRKITVLKLFIAKFCTNYLAHVLLNSLWASILFDKGYLYYLWSSMIKNSVLLPIEVLLLALFFRALLPLFARMKLLPEHSKEDLAKLSFSASIFPILGLSAIAGGGAALYYGFFSQGGAIFQGLGYGLMVIGVGLLITGLVFKIKRKKEAKAAEKEAENQE